MYYSTMSIFSIGDSVKLTKVEFLRKEERDAFH
jgi:hypothetical protein